MRAVVQRVSRAMVEVEEKVVSSINRGILVFLGVGEEDALEDAEYLADKIINLRIFEDEKGKMNLSVLDVGGEVLVVSQFTLYGDVRKGKRPSFTMAAPQDKAIYLYEEFVKFCREKTENVKTGQFQAHMIVKLENDGPVTILLDSKKTF
ncbi:D-aminoacyl-tRNA deacylase [Thermovenabulum sp.]|uniref:D-aminoacyl-tRNA deacylase n=1 Tax=Thermovenabulum sp. TaxID=3100335 RepID=UPI003C7BDC9C